MLVPGAGGAAWYWSRVIPLLQRAGHEAVAVDLPGDDENAGLPEYARLVVAAIGESDDVVLVAQSLGGFTAPLVCTRVAVRELVFVNAMIPTPGETPGAWWDNTGWLDARERAALADGYSTEFDLNTYFLHDVPPEVAAEGGSASAARGRRRLRVGVRFRGLASHPDPGARWRGGPVLPARFPACDRTRSP